MSRFIELFSTISIVSEVIPYVNYGLQEDGFALVRIPQSIHLETALIVASALIGQALGKHFSYHFIEGDSEPNNLAAHTEGIAYKTGIVPYFALGCIRPADNGGETRVFDARRAAGLAVEKGMGNVLMEYSSLAHPDQIVRSPLIVNDPDYGQVLRYRSKVVTNSVVSNEFTEPEVYEAVDEILEQVISHVHEWTKGDLLFINNKMTLHDRLSYKGKRSMLRVRYDDGLHRDFKF